MLSLPPVYVLILLFESNILPHKFILNFLITQYNVQVDLTFKWT